MSFSAFVSPSIERISAAPASAARPLSRLALPLLAASAILSAGSAFSQQKAAPADPLEALQQNFITPPADARPMMRWWWFGPAVTHEELRREILAMKAGGIGGFEIQPVYPMALDDDAKGFHNTPYLSNAFLDAVRFANTTAHANGMRVDMTLASGWPYGGPHVPVDQASSRIRFTAVDLPAHTTSVALPPLANGESLLATFLGRGSADHYEASALQLAEPTQSNGRATFAAANDNRVAVFYIASRTGQQVKRAAAGAEGFVLDHLSRAAIDNHLATVGNRLMTAFGTQPPYAVFSDSLEVYESDWTTNFLAEFQRRRGYDLKPLLPELTSGTGEKSAQLCHDWGLTLTELANANYLTPINDWAKAHHTRFRSQTYGEPAVSMSSNALVSLPEGEGPQWNSFSFTRWATSASHLYNRPVTSAETWTWLHSPAFRATPLDMKAEADRFFLEGVNQLIGHGWPYTPPGTPEPGWSFYAAAVFNDHNPWYVVMPDVTRYLQRASFLLRQGQPANDVAIFLPNDDAYALFRPGHASLSAEMPHFVTPALMRRVLSSGYNVDYIDSEAIAAVGIHYPILILPHVERLTPATLRSLISYADKGGHIIAIGSKPALSPGFVNADSVTADVRKLSQQLFASPTVHFLADESKLPETLHKALPPDLQLAEPSEAIGFIHRKLATADIYFIANTSNKSIEAIANFRSNRAHASMWNLDSGRAGVLASGPITLSLAPYGSTVIVLSDQPFDHLPMSSPVTATQPSDLSHNWTITFPNHPAQPLANLHSWSDDPSTRFFSGVATYTKTLHLTSDQVSHPFSLDFGPSTPTPPEAGRQHGTAAELNTPIRDAAIILVNGKRIGSLWHPPYTIDLTNLHAGDTTIEIQVANTDMNLLAGQSRPSYRLLNLRYGERFIPQDTDRIQPLPSGILGKLQLLETK
ncbi:MAG: glycosyl hydrolase [Acidobacteriota bacterium]